MASKTIGKSARVAEETSELLSKTLPERIRDLRHEKGISQFEAAYGSGMSLTFYHRLEKGSQNPSIRVLEQIAKYYGVKLTSLLG